jgi:hypothetical protein
MSYAVDNKDVLSRVKVGDQIAAKVYDGDSTLYEVEVIPQSKAGALPKTNRPGLRLEDLEQMALGTNPTQEVASSCTFYSGYGRTPSSPRKKVRWRLLPGDIPSLAHQ